MEGRRLGIGRLRCLSPPLWANVEPVGHPSFPVDMDPVSEPANGIIVIRAVV